MLNYKIQCIESIVVMSAWNIWWFSISQDLDNYVCLPAFTHLSLSLSLSLIYKKTKLQIMQLTEDWLCIDCLYTGEGFYLSITYHQSPLCPLPLRISPSNEPLDWGFPCGQRSLPDVGEGCGFDRIHLERVEQGDYVRGLTGVLTAILASVGLRPGIGYLCSVRAEGPCGKTICICIRCT